MKIFFAIIFIFWSGVLYAAPFACDAGQVFSDLNSCNHFCGAVSGGKLSCKELDKKSSTSPCDTSKYRFFAYSDGKTFAITNNTVSWNSEKTAIIRNSTDNAVIASLLSSAGISKAWIGATDKSMSSGYNNIDAGRFVWRNGDRISYSNWMHGEPNNRLNAAAIGVSPIYGEHWVAINSSGYWEDLGYNDDGSERLLHAVVEFNGELSCVAGKEKKSATVGGGVSGMVCGGKENSDGIISLNKCSSGLIFNTTNTGYLCDEGKVACNSSVMETSVEKTETFKGTVGYSGSCSGSDGCKFPSEFTPMKPERKITLSADRKTIQIQTRRQVASYGSNDNTIWRDGSWVIEESHSFEWPIKSFKYTAIQKSAHWFSPSNAGCGGDAGSCPDYIDNWGGSSIGITYGEIVVLDNEADKVIRDPQFSYAVAYIAGRTATYEMTLSVTYEIKEYHTSYTCPYSGRPCIQSGGSYYCSPTDCLDASSSSSYIQDDSVEGGNDADNNGELSPDGLCLGKLVIFPGRDNRCRPNGIQTAGQNCCRIASVEESQKPDVAMSKEETAALMFATGMTFLTLFSGDASLNICSGSEKSLWVNRGYDQCVYIGQYCSEKWKIGGCVQNKQTFCCFDSDFSRAFNEAGMEMLGKSWGTAKSPNCGGFSPEEMQELSAMDIANHPKMREYADKLGAEFSNKLMNEFNQTFQSPSFKSDFEKQIEEQKK